MVSEVFQVCLDGIFLKFPMNIYLTRMIGQSHDISNNDPDGPMVGNALGVKVRVVSFYMLDIPEECCKSARWCPMFCEVVL